MAWTQVQNSAVQQLGTGAGNGGTSLAVTLAGVTAGNLLVVFFTTWAAGNGGSGAVTASGWDSSVAQASASTGGSNARTGVLFLKNAPSGSNTATLSWANSADCSAYIIEFHDSAGTNPTLDGSATGQGSGSPEATGNSTSAVTGDLEVIVIGDDGATVTYTPSGGQTNVGGNNGSSTLPTVQAARLLSTSSVTNSGAWTSQDGSGGSTTPGGWAGVIACFRATQAAGAPAYIPQLATRRARAPEPVRPRTSELVPTRPPVVLRATVRRVAAPPPHPRLSQTPVPIPAATPPAFVASPAARRRPELPSVRARSTPVPAPITTTPAVAFVTGPAGRRRPEVPSVRPRLNTVPAPITTTPAPLFVTSRSSRRSAVIPSVRARSTPVPAPITSTPAVAAVYLGNQPNDIKGYRWWRWAAQRWEAFWGSPL